MSYDLIGDIHGCADTLKALLKTLGYSRRHGVYEHAQRQAIFLGDFIDRGPKQRETIEIVRPMIDQETALSVVGNHEFNAVSFATPRKDGCGHLRQRNEKHTNQHEAFLIEYADDPTAWKEVIEWFRELPLWLEIDGLRAVHAVWCADTVGRLTKEHDARALASDDFLHTSNEMGAWEFDAVELLLKGQEVEMPPGVEYFDKDGNRRTAMRTRWWDASFQTYREAYLGPPEYRDAVPEDPLPGKLPYAYGHDQPPVFVGHYWQTGDPSRWQPTSRVSTTALARTVHWPLTGGIVSRNSAQRNSLPCRGLSNETNVFDNRLNRSGVELHVSCGADATEYLRK